MLSIKLQHNNLFVALKFLYLDILIVLYINNMGLFVATPF